MSTKNSKANSKSKSKRHVFTQESATVFEHTSDKNAAIVTGARECACEAYVDIFTFDRWLAQGLVVQKGQKGTRIATYRPIYKDDPDTGERVKTGSVPVYKTVFCRCQVGKPEPKTKTAKPTRRARKAKSAARKTSRKVNVKAA